jgi:hypothetical protein
MNAMFPVVNHGVRGLATAYPRFGLVVTPVTPEAGSGKID